jgi:hypothetical protein
MPGLTPRVFWSLSLERNNFTEQIYIEWNRTIVEGLVGFWFGTEHLIWRNCDYCWKAITWIASIVYFDVSPWTRVLWNILDVKLILVGLVIGINIAGWYSWVERVNCGFIWVCSTLGFKCFTADTIKNQNPIRITCVLHWSTTSKPRPTLHKNVEHNILSDYLWLHLEQSRAIYLYNLWTYKSYFR